MAGRSESPSAQITPPCPRAGSTPLTRCPFWSGRWHRSRRGRDLRRVVGRRRRPPAISASDVSRPPLRDATRLVRDQSLEPFAGPERIPGRCGPDQGTGGAVRVALLEKVLEEVDGRLRLAQQAIDHRLHLERGGAGEEIVLGQDNRPLGGFQSLLTVAECCVENPDGGQQVGVLDSRGQRRLELLQGALEVGPGLIQASPCRGR